MKKLDLVHPGVILDEEFLKPLGITQYRLAQGIDVPARRINEIVHAQRSITADTAVRLAEFFGTSEMFWMNLQSRYELDRLADERTAPASRAAARVASKRSQVAKRAPRVSSKRQAK